jgi:allantoate deiminase
MVFVRSAGGRSHTPEEFSTVSDCAKGIRVVAEALRQQAY